MIPIWAKPGAKVVCIQGGGPSSLGARLAGGFPVTGGVYTVDGARFDDLYGMALLHLVEFPTMETRRGGLMGWNAARFRPLISRTQEQDVALFKSLLNPTLVDKLDLLAERMNELAAY